MIEIVPFSRHHLSGVVDVILPIQQLEFNIPITLDDQPDLLDVPGFYQKGSGNFWVALHGSEVVGTIALLDIGKNQGALRKMFVKEPFRGSKQGTAHKLLRTLLDWCEIHTISEIYLGTTARFLAAHRFYEKNGFSEIQQSELPISFPVMSVVSCNRQVFCNLINLQFSTHFSQRVFQA
jgi:N-acetylglutamate synthase-like GNAT family acetyltransferase